MKFSPVDNLTERIHLIYKFRGDRVQVFKKMSFFVLSLIKATLENQHFGI